MTDKTTRKQTLHAVIMAYREVIKSRYDYDLIVESYEISDAFTPERIAVFRDYFLDYIYPLPDKRDELDGAFRSLDNYIKHPEKLMRLLIDSSSLLFKYGRHLPKILKAGIKALKSFRSATDFENKLVNHAISMNLSAPYSQENINTLITALSIGDINIFIKNNEALFETLQDRKLVEKILEIVEHLIAKMRKRPKIYSKEEIRGLEIGRDIIQQGNALFNQLSEEEQEMAFDFVLTMERDNLEELFV